MDERLKYLIEVSLSSGVFLFLLRFLFYWSETRKKQRFEKVFADSAEIAELLSNLRKEIGAARVMLNSTHNGQGFPVVGKNLYLSVINESVSDRVDVFPVKSYLQNWLLDDSFVSMVSKSIQNSEEVLTFNISEMESKNSVNRMSSTLFGLDRLIFVNIGQKHNRYYYISMSWTKDYPADLDRVMENEFYIKSTQNKIRDILETGNRGYLSNFVNWVRSKLMP